MISIYGGFAVYNSLRINGFVINIEDAWRAIGSVDYRSHI